MYVIVTGNIFDGIRILGPFKTEHDADEYGREYLFDTLYTVREVEAVE